MKWIGLLKSQEHEQNLSQTEQEKREDEKSGRKQKIMTDLAEIEIIIEEYMDVMLTH